MEKSSLKFSTIEIALSSFCRSLSSKSPIVRCNLSLLCNLQTEPNEPLNDLNYIEQIYHKTATVVIPDLNQYIRQTSSTPFNLCITFLKNHLLRLSETQKSK